MFAFKKSALNLRTAMAARNRVLKPVAFQPGFFKYPVRAFSGHKDNFMSGANANYIDYMYAQWEQDPTTVHASWNAYFSGGSDSFMTPPTLDAPTSGGTPGNLD